jgi:hypothetical protein
MTLRVRCFALILLIAAAWIGDLQARAGVNRLPVQPFACEQEFVLLSLEFRQDVLEKIESSHAVTLDFQPAIVELNVPLAFSMSSHEPRLFSSADICYLFMSLKC